MNHAHSIRKSNQGIERTMRGEQIGRRLHIRIFLGIYNMSLKFDVKFRTLFFLRRLKNAHMRTSHTSESLSDNYEKEILPNVWSKTFLYSQDIRTLDSAMFITSTLSNTLAQFTGSVCYQFGSQSSSAVLQNRPLTKGSLCMTISPSACEFWFEYIKPTTKVTDWVTIADTKWIWAHNKSITPCIITENAINMLYRKDPLPSFRTSCNGHSCNTNFESLALGLNKLGLCF